MENRMTETSNADTYTLGDKPVARIGYGAMQLAGPAYLALPKTVSRRLLFCAKP